MKKYGIVGYFFLCIAMLSSCTHASLYRYEGETYVSKKNSYRYAQGIVDGWRPISGKRELLGFVDTGNLMPVYGFQGDSQRAVIYVGQYGTNRVQPGYYHRADLVFPEVNAEGITSILYIPKSKWDILMSPNNESGLTTAVATDAISDKAIISELTGIITDGRRILLSLLAKDEEYGLAFTMQWAGIVLFLNDGFPGICKSINIYSDTETHYFVTTIDARNAAECFELPTELVEQLCDMQA